MTVINSSIMTNAAIAISNFIKNIDADITAGVHPVLSQSDVHVTVEIKLDNETTAARETYIATGKVAGLPVCKIIGFKSATEANHEMENRPTVKIMMTKIAKVMLDNAEHTGDTFYDLQCAVNNPKEGDVFRCQLATGHVVIVADGIAKIYDVTYAHVADVVLAQYPDFGQAMVHINRAIYGHMASWPFAAFNLKG